MHRKLTQRNVKLCELRLCMRNSNLLCNQKCLSGKKKKNRANLKFLRITLSFNFFNLIFNFIAIITIITVNDISLLSQSILLLITMLKAKIMLLLLVGDEEKIIIF